MHIASQAILVLGSVLLCGNVFGEGAGSQACTGIEAVDFKNHVMVAKQGWTFAFHNGIFDDGEMDEGKFVLDTRSEIVRDVVVHPVPSLAVRFVEVFQNHLGGSGSYEHLFAFRCSGGRIVSIFHQSGEGMEVLRLSPNELRLRFGVWRKSDPHCCPSTQKYSRFVWDNAKATFMLRQERFQRCCAAAGTS